jgi:predicted N-acetyltransferase YhbS
MKTKIREAVIEDASELSEITKRAFKDDIPNYGEIPQEIVAVESHIAMMHEQGTEYFVATDNNQIVGGIVVQNKRNQDYRLALIYTDYEFQRKGIGRQLFRYTEQKYQDAKTWRVETLSLNIKDQKFYEYMGFKKIGEYRINERMIAYQYEKNINDN